MEGVGILGSRVVAPDDDVLDLLQLGASPVTDLSQGSGLIESRHGSEVLLWNGRSVSGRNQGIGVGWVSNHADLDGLLSELVEDCSLLHEYLCICLQKVCSLHAWTSRSGSDQQSNIDVGESLNRTSARYNLLDASVGTVFQLHAETVERAFSLRKLEEMENNLLVRAKHASLSDEVTEESADLTSGACDGNSDSVLL